MLRVFVEVHLLYLGGSHDYARKESSKLTKLTSYLGSSVHRRNASESPVQGSSNIRRILAWTSNFLYPSCLYFLILL